MIMPSNWPFSPSETAQRGRRRWQYVCLLAMQSIGAVILFWKGIPLYRQVLVDPAAHVATTETLVWSLFSIGLIQLGYWVSHWVRPPLPRFTSALLGNIILFFARMSFVFATSVFGLVFITQRPGFQIPVSRYIVTLLGLFSLYCYVQELELLGRLLLRKDKPMNFSAP